MSGHQQPSTSNTQQQQWNQDPSWGHASSSRKQSGHQQGKMETLHLDRSSVHDRKVHIDIFRAEEEPVFEPVNKEYNKTYYDDHNEVRGALI